MYTIHIHSMRCLNQDIPDEVFSDGFYRSFFNVCSRNGLDDILLVVRGYR